MLDDRKKLQLVLAKRGYMNEDLVNEIEQIYNKQQLPIHGVSKSVACGNCDSEESDMYCQKCYDIAYDGIGY